jgi:tyrosyl-tRNA synthetase
MARSKEAGATRQERGSARIPSEEELHWITERAVAEIIPRDEFVAALKSGRALRLKMGFDPSAPDLTLGHAVGLRKLRQLQDLGHTVVVIVGDWTARIGDPSGQSKTRPMLTAEQVRENAETYLQQFSRIVDRELTEIRWQSEWFDEFTLTTVVNLAAKFTVAQMLERGDFAERFKGQKPIGIHELFYPLLQAYDSVAVQADVEFGGTDQTFNLIVGRHLQPEFGQRAQAVFTVPLLVGMDGVKMSKSQGNYVALEESPHEMYGKLMSITDPLVGDYFELLTDVPDQEVDEIRGAIASGGTRARDAKMRLAREIVAAYHGEPPADEAEAEFRRVFSERETPDDAEVCTIDFNGSSETKIDLTDALIRSGLAASKSEVRRLIAQGAVETDGVRVQETSVRVGRNSVIRVGKHRFLRIVDTSAD